MIAETIKLLIEVKELPKKASKDLKFAYGNDYLPFSFRDMFRHLKKNIVKTVQVVIEVNSKDAEKNLSEVNEQLNIQKKY